MSEDERLVAGRYRLGASLGRGGMADVHVARDEVLDRDVAVKLLRRRYLEDDTFLERFRREARAAARLNHRSIVSVHDTGDDDGVPFIVMELVPGRSLDRLLDERGAVPVEPALTILSQVCEALAYAHDRGVVHRDVKPGNILVVDDDGGPTVKVADFGIARAAGEDTITLTSVLGTAAYLSPEQAQGKRVDHRSDLYSAGIVLYELLTGAPPYDAGTPVQVALRHVGAQPDPPSQQVDGVSEDLDAVVLTALAKDPEGRYGSAEALRRDLQAVLRDDAVSVGLPTAVAGAAGLAGPSQTLRLPDETLAMGAGADDAGPDGTTAVASGRGDVGHRPRRWVAAGALAVLVLFAALALLASGDDRGATEQVTPSAPAADTTAPPPADDEQDDEDDEGDGGPPDDRGPPGDRGRGND